MIKIAHYFYEEFDRKFFDLLPDNIESIDNSCDSSVDLIYCSTIARLSDAFAAKVKYNKPLICWVWDIPYNWREWPMTPEDEKFAIPLDFPNLITILKNYCELVISASKNTQRVLREIFNVASEQIYFYADVDLSSVPSIETKDKSVIQISRFTPHKRFELGIDAVQDIEASLTCVGKNKNELYFKKLQAHAKRNVIFLHNISRERVITELTKAAVLIAPTIFEGFGLSPIEAISCGTPIVLNDMPVFREIYGDAAIYHKQDDVNDLQQKLMMVLDDVHLQKKIVKDCKQIIAPFTPKLFVKRWMKLLFH
ncbi:MAG: glycosyltransferase [candidate division Zixibacteria bacterium]|nr:glycosyltransferase [candidate division Zixibacteria bacterium]